MLKIMAFMAIAVTLMVATPDAEAKRFGGGASFGKMFKTKPAQQQKQAPVGNTAAGQKATTTGSKRGIMGGMLGGLLVGGLLASIFGGAFEGIQMMDILIFGLIAFFAFRWFKKMNMAKAQAQEHQHAFAGDMPNFGQQTPSQAGGSSLATADAFDDVPMNLPRDFDAETFIQGALSHYRTIQDAWNANDLNTIESYVSPEIYAQLVAERESLGGEQHTEILSLEASIVRADYNNSHAQLSLQFTGHCRDNVEHSEDAIADIWHLQRDLSADDSPWLVIGIE